MLPDPGDFCHWPAWPVPFGLDIPIGPLETCPYLDGQTARFRSFWAESLSPLAYHRLMDAGFRRSGQVIYQPACPACRQCVPIRVDAARFQPSKSQRRVLRRNEDVHCRMEESRATAEKLDLYNRYVRAWHGGAPVSAGEFELLFHDSPVRTADLEHRDGAGKLLAVGICDLSAESLSSVYFYFAPEEEDRSLGVWGALKEIEHCQTQGIPYYYLGYWVEPCSKMNYKNRFRPAEILCPDGVWREQFT